MTLHRYRTEVVVLFTREVNAHSTEDAEHIASRYARSILGDLDDVHLSEVDVDDVTTVPIQCVPPCVRCTPKTELERELNNANLKMWLESEALKLGTDAQRSRWADGTLTEEEILAIARAELFKPFGEFTKRAKMRENALPHTADCRDGGVKWSTAESYSAVTLSKEEWRSHKRFAVVAAGAMSHPWLFRTGTKINLGARVHRGDCNGCSAWVAEYTVLVEIPWAGRILSREYVL